jgi:ribosomal protein L11 methyltransferase
VRTYPALLIRFTSSTAIERSAVQELTAAALDDLAPTAIQESDDEWLVFFSTAEGRDRARQILPAAARRLVEVDARDVADEDWARRSQQDLEPVIVGRVTIAPPWRVAAGTPRVGDARPAPGEAVTIAIQPSMGFGTGHHATTRLCTALLQHVDLAGRTVLDVGTGSGVLALVARALGARRVVAVDDDPDAVESARENLALNGVAEGIDLRVADFRSLPAIAADVVTANLTGGLLIRGADLLAASVGPGGTLVISGVMLEEEDTVVAAFTPTLALAGRVTEDEWMAARFTRG